MTIDIVTLLRDQHCHNEDWLREMCLVAASEIERLRNGLELIREHPWGYERANHGHNVTTAESAAQEMIAVARRTLSGEHQLPPQTELRDAHVKLGPMTTEILNRYGEENEKLNKEIDRLRYEVEKRREDLLWVISKLRNDEVVGNV